MPFLHFFAIFMVFSNLSWLFSNSVRLISISPNLKNLRISRFLR